MTETSAASLLRRLVERRSQQRDLDKIVEVAGLQRGVLSIVCEAAPPG